MQGSEVFFAIPTYRLREVGETVERYDEHFWRNGHAVPMIVFDDSSPANQEKYYPLLEQTRTHNSLYYVGPREKDQFLAYLNERLRDKRLAFLCYSSKISFMNRHHPHSRRAWFLCPNSAISSSPECVKIRVTEIG